MLEKNGAVHHQKTLNDTCEKKKEKEKHKIVLDKNSRKKQQKLQDKKRRLLVAPGAMHFGSGEMAFKTQSFACNKLNDWLVVCVTIW